MAVEILVDVRTGMADPRVPFLAADSQGAVRGDGVFETVLVRAGRPWWLCAHLERLVHSAAALGLCRPDSEAWRAAIAAAVARWGRAEDLVLRLVLPRSPTPDPLDGYVLGSAVPPEIRAGRESPISVVSLQRGISARPAEAPWLLGSAKTLSYAVNLAALREAARRGADDAVFVSLEELVLEGPTSTVIIERDGGLLTPAAHGAILLGTTCAALFAAAAAHGIPCGPAELSVADLLAADAVYLASSVRLLAAVGELDGRRLPTDAARATELIGLLESVALAG